jgi:hypothetical protein
VAMGHSEDGVGEEKSSAAPNISLNFQDPEVFSPIFPGAPRIKLLIATTLGVVLQTGSRAVMEAHTRKQESDLRFREHYFW